jgi:hypothetical protein
MQGHSNWKQLKRGPPEHEELLQEMFGGIVVDVSSACAPGEAFERRKKGLLLKNNKEMIVIHMHHPIQVHMFQKEAC